MSGSSGHQGSAFDGVRWPHVTALLDVLGDNVVCDERQIERRYKQLAWGYDRTFAFLLEIGMVERAERGVVGKAAWDTKSNRRDEVLGRLVGADSRYRDGMFGYLRAFEIVGGDLVRNADITDRLRESPCRNFLMELGVVRHRSSVDDYVLEPEYVSLYAAAREAAGGASPARVRLCCDGRTTIGDRAESAVVAWEQKRLGAAHAARVQHIARRNASAGYDVLSATLAPERVLPRYIEVKAVSGRTFQFFWSENEVKVARVLGSLYYLYLVPVDSTGAPAVGGARIICNPYTTVLNGADWEIEANVRSCRPTGGPD